MRKSTIDKIEEEINKKIIMPDNQKEKIRKEVFTNIVIAIIMIVYFTFLIMGSIGNTKDFRTIDFNIFSILLLGVSIYLFEYSYRKDRGKLAIFGIETLVTAILTLFFPYIIYELDNFHKKYYMIIASYIGVYYIIKSIIIAQRAKRMYQKEKSDIKDIVKKEKVKAKVEEEIQENKEKNDKKLEEQKYKQTKKREQSNKSKPVVNNKTNKSGRPKKIEEQGKEELSKKVDAPKKRGRPRKAVVK